MRGKLAVALLVVMASGVAGGVTADAAHAKSAMPALPGHTYSWTFAADTLGLPPNATRVGGGKWSVEEDSTQAGARLLRQTESDDGLAFHMLQFLKPRVADQKMEVRYRIRSGDIDPSVGISFHLDPKGKNGYLVRISGRNRELIAHYLLNGKRRDIKMVSVDPPQPGDWHTLGVRREGERLEVLMDGVVKMRLRDERFSIGNVGLWTEDDTVADFAGMTVTTL